MGVYFIYPAPPPQGFERFSNYKGYESSLEFVGPCTDTADVSYKLRVQRSNKGTFLDNEYILWWKYLIIKAAVLCWFICI